MGLLIEVLKRLVLGLVLVVLPWNRTVHAHPVQPGRDMDHAVVVGGLAALSSRVGIQRDHLGVDGVDGALARPAFQVLRQRGINPGNTGDHR